MDNYDEEELGLEANVSAEEADVDDGDHEEQAEGETQGDDDDDLAAALQQALVDAEDEDEDYDRTDEAAGVRATQDEEDDDILRAGGEEDDVDPYSQADHEGDIDAHGPRVDEDFPGSQQMQDVQETGGRRRLTAVLQDPKAKRIFALMSVMSEEQLNRYEAYKRSQLPRPKVKKLMQSLTSYQPHERVIIAVSGVAKIFVGQLIETARRIASKEGHDGPLLPNQVQQAYQQLDSTSKWPSVLSAPSRCMFPRRMSATPSLPVVFKPGDGTRVVADDKDLSNGMASDFDGEDEDELDGYETDEDGDVNEEGVEEGMEYEMQERGDVAGDGRSGPEQHQRPSHIPVQVH